MEKNVLSSYKYHCAVTKEHMCTYFGQIGNYNPVSLYGPVHQILILIILSSNECSDKLAYVQTHQSIRCGYTQGMNVDEDSDQN